MEKTKKQKYDQEIRKSLKTILTLQPELLQFLKELPLQKSNLLSKTCLQIHGLKLLRILTLIEINFIVSTFLDILQKTKSLKIQNLKIGIIGAGIMGRLIINTLLVFTKQGFKTQNLLVSTRQSQSLNFYVQNFGIKAFFDNQKIAQEAHLIFVATHATLDNWILVDLNNHLKSRTNITPVSETNKSSNISTVSVQNVQQQGNIKQPQPKSNQNNKKAEVQKQTFKNFPTPNKEEPISLNPFVYILTSDFTQQKCQKIFDFPVMIPWFRASNLTSIIEQIRTFMDKKSVQQLSEEPENVIKQIQSFLSTLLQKKFLEEQLMPIDKLNQPQSRLQSLLQVFSFSCKDLQKQWKKQNLFSKKKNQLQVNQTNDFYNQLLRPQGSYSETFLTKARKWRMAYNNFIV